MRLIADKFTQDDPAEESLLEVYCWDLNCKNCGWLQTIWIKKGFTKASVAGENPICKYCGCAMCDVPPSHVAGSDLIEIFESLQGEVFGGELNFREVRISDFVNWYQLNEEKMKEFDLLSVMQYFGDFVKGPHPALKPR